MKFNKILISIIVLFILTVCLFYFSKKLFSPKGVHYHAGFQVYIDGKLQDFSGQQYMSLVPCGIVSHDERTEQLEKAHLHEQVGDVVHVHRDNATWADLFKNINFKIDNSKNVNGYINGKKTQDILSQKIKPYDSIIILIGKQQSITAYLSHAVTVEHIKNIEKQSESCGT